MVLTGLVGTTLNSFFQGIGIPGGGSHDRGCAFGAKAAEEFPGGVVADNLITKENLTTALET